MCWIGTVNVGRIALPDDEPRPRRSSIGTDSAGGVHIVKIGEPLRDLTLILRHKTQDLLTELEAFLWANETTEITLTPDAWIDFGSGLGVAITAVWMSSQFRPPKVTADAFDITLEFRKTG